MKSFVILFLIKLLPSNYLNAQIYSIKYHVKYNLNKNSNDIKESIMILDSDGKTSIFRPSTQKEIDSLNSINKAIGTSLGVSNQFYIKKDLLKNKTTKIISHDNKNYFLPMLENSNWTITSERKHSGDFLMQKAIGSFGGRKWIAWFDSRFQMNDGPYVFHNLPGLIIQLNDENHEYSFNLVQISKTTQFFNVRKKDIEINWKQYKTLALSYYNDPMVVKNLTGKIISFKDPQRNNLDIREMNRKMQAEIIKENNPIEFNNKIKY